MDSPLKVLYMSPLSLIKMPPLGGIFYGCIIWLDEFYSLDL